MPTTSHPVFLPSFGLHIPGIKVPLQEQNIHPISIETKEGLDLDFSALMALIRLL
jgi:hypothetical protein